jgi:hypothetical protein
MKQLVNENDAFNRSKLEQMQLELRKIEKLDRGAPLEQADHKMRTAISDL